MQINLFKLFLELKYTLENCPTLSPLHLNFCAHTYFYYCPVIFIIILIINCLLLYEETGGCFTVHVFFNCVINKKCVKEETVLKSLFFTNTILNTL